MIGFVFEYYQGSLLALIPTGFTEKRTMENFHGPFFGVY